MTRINATYYTSKVESVYKSLAFSLKSLVFFYLGPVSKLIALKGCKPLLFNAKNLMKIISPKMIHEIKTMNGKNSK